MPTKGGDIRDGADWGEKARPLMPVPPETRGPADSESVNNAPRHRLSSAKIVETATNLADDIGARLPRSTLAAQATELKATAVTADDRVRRAQQPMVSIRLLSAAAVVGVLLAALVSRPPEEGRSATH